MPICGESIAGREKSSAKILGHLCLGQMMPRKFSGVCMAVSAVALRLASRDVLQAVISEWSETEITNSSLICMEARML